MNDLLDKVVKQLTAEMGQDSFTNYNDGSLVGIEQYHEIVEEKVNRLTNYELLSLISRSLS